MRKVITKALATAFCSAALVAGGIGEATAQDKYGLDTSRDKADIVRVNGHKAMAGVVRVKFKNTPEVNARLNNLLNTRASRAGEVKGKGKYIAVTGLDELNAQNRRFGVQQMERVFRPSGKFEARHRAWGLHLWYEIKVNDKEELTKVMAAYKNLDIIQDAEPQYEREMTALSGTPNDPQYSTQANHYDLVNATQAWGIETGSSDVVVAIEDAGVDLNHPDLDGHIWTNPGETPGNGIDDDNNGYVDDYYGWNFGDNNSDIAIGSHGTHVGGTVAAETNNGTGVSGVAGGSGSNDGVRLMTLSVFGNNSNGGFDEAFVYAADNGAVISQNSWGGGGQSNALENAIDYFIANAGGSGQPLDGGLAVFAAGNSNTNSTTSGYPGSYSPVVAVSSTTYDGTKSSFSNYGTWVDIAAPGSDILSTYPVAEGSYNTISGTSMACPHVSGVAALVVSNKYRNGESLTAGQLRNILESTANTSLLYDNKNGGYVDKLGSGILDAYAALTGQVAPPPSPPSCSGDFSTEVTVSITTDQYGSETSWTIKDNSDGSTVASGSGYGNNSSYTENVTLDADGNYTFTITDDYGDGICCSYGNGSYSVVDANGSSIASGGDFNDSESTVFCTEGASAPVNNAPVASISGSSAGETGATLSFDGSGSSDADGDALTYTWNFGDGSTGSGVTASHAYSSAGTYNVTLTVSDGTDSDNATTSVSITDPAPVGLDCSSTVSAPYSTGFEGSSGWTQGSGDDFDWAINSGGTPSSNTGPSAASEGSNYAFIESSNPNYPSKVAILNSPCFDLSGASSSILTFDYHMYGASNMGGLTLEADNGSGWSAIWSLSGNQGNAWNGATVDLSAYAGGDVKLRFVGVTGDTWQGDMAIDNMNITDGSTTPPSNTQVTLTIELDNYGGETSWTLKDGSGNTIDSDSYSSNQSNTTVTSTFDLADGCYDFTINDAYGDGICCSYGNGSYVLEDASGSVLASGGDFNSTETKNFCVGNSTASTEDGVKASAQNAPEFGITVYPNPVSGKSFKVQTGSMMNAKLMIYNATGQVMTTQDVDTDQRIEVNATNFRTGIYIVKLQSDNEVSVKKLIVE